MSTEYLWSIWKRGHRFRAVRPGQRAPSGYSLIAYHAGGEIQCRACAKSMEEDEQWRREGRVGAAR